MGGVVVYVVIDVALVFLRPHFSVLHSAESDYGSAGRYAWVMDCNFVLRCALSIAAVRAIALAVPQSPRLRAGLTLLLVWALCSGLLALFPDDPAGTTIQTAGRVHLVIAAFAFVGVAVGTRITTRALARESGWRPLVPALAVFSWGAFLPALLLAHSHLRVHTLGGLYEKLFLALELAWLFTVSARVAGGAPLRSGRTSSPQGSHPSR